jgi:hypothetical protein
MLLNSKTSAAARIDAKFVVNAGHMGVDHAWVDHEFFGRLGIGQPLSHQLQHLHFPNGLARRTRGLLQCGP